MQNLTLVEYIFYKMIFVKDTVFFLILVAFVSCNVHQKKRHQNHKYNKRIYKNPLLVKTENGWVLGAKMYDYMYSWRGIRYAKPPIGELRFEAPQPPDDWNEIWNATFDRSICYQSSNNLFEAPQGSEDCLYINVYTPQLPSENLKPVMFWIYGGGFLNGDSRYSTFGPDYLVQKDCIVVTFNYRLNIFGFASTGDDTLPGNNGLRDQILALQWVQSNIKAFGGDPKRVTIFGESAGAVSVSYLLESPLAKGLFQFAIMESGTVLCPWAISRKVVQATSLIGAKIFGINTANSTELLSRLKNERAQNLLNQALIVQTILLAPDPLNGLIFAPIQEHKHKDAVFSGYSYEIQKKGAFNRVPCIIGFNSAEVIFFSELLKILQIYLLSYDLFPSRLVPVDMYANNSQLDGIGKEIRLHYAGRFGAFVFPDNDTIRYFSNDLFVRPIRKTVDLASKYARVYLYRFSYTADSGEVGAGHADELKYIFKSNLTTKRDREVSEYLVNMWTNFAKTGNPTPRNENTLPGNITWAPVKAADLENVPFLDINVKPTAGINPEKINVNFWYDLYDKYGKPKDTF